ncbi:hypothetical protein LTR37_014576 [Vermiconidia calcicola]|uniref:Uncharacterized protein n=1 Tax=Vermiconidia calcicola TaxID=1690605 RepID=A0ACC3MUP2_9PEZI|nr:hypothetical protein LTR37_014576 [Vermiconidia calcicola]
MPCTTKGHGRLVHNTQKQSQNSWRDAGDLRRHVYTVHVNPTTSGVLPTYPNIEVADFNPRRVERGRTQSKDRSAKARSASSNTRARSNSRGRASTTGTANGGETAVRRETRSRSAQRKEDKAKANASTGGDNMTFVAKDQLQLKPKKSILSKRTAAQVDTAEEDQSWEDMSDEKLQRELKKVKLQEKRISLEEEIEKRLARS